MLNTKNKKLYQNYNVIIYNASSPNVLLNHAERFFQISNYGKLKLNECEFKYQNVKSWTVYDRTSCM